MVAHGSDRLAGVHGLDRGPALHLQRAPEKAADCGLVVHYQDSGRAMRHEATRPGS